MNKNLNLFTAMLSILLLASLVSCQKETPVVSVSSTFKLEAPLEAPDARYSDLTITITHIKTGKVTTITSAQVKGNTVTAELYEGKNKIEINGKMTVTDPYGVESVSDFTHTGELTVVRGQALSPIVPVYNKPTSGFVIEEVFFNPHNTPENKKGISGEQYIKITNNSSSILYADGLVILESEFKTNMKQDYKPNIMATDIAVGAIAMIPGTGHDYPVQPGASIVIANDAQNHSLKNPNAINLETADFEWFDVSPNPKFQDQDNLKVPNLNKIYAKTLTLHTFMQRGSTAIAIGKMPITPEEYLAKHKYAYSYLFSFKGYNKEMKSEAYSFPNKWIIDAVNLSVVESFAWIVTDPSVDSGHTGWSDTESDASAVGKSARRKVQSTIGERKVYQDTNDSSKDFERKVTPSLERK